MEIEDALRRTKVWAVAFLTVLGVLAQIPAALAQDASTTPGDSPITLINLNICTVQGLPVPDPLDENSVTTSVLAVMGDIPPPTPVFDDRRANDCCILITPPDREYRISIAARLAVEARFLRLQDENAVRHLYELIEFCDDEITKTAFLSTYGGPPGDKRSSGKNSGERTGGGGGGGPPNPSYN